MRQAEVLTVSATFCLAFVAAARPDDLPAGGKLSVDCEALLVAALVAAAFFAGAFFAVV